MKKTPIPLLFLHLCLLPAGLLAQSVEPSLVSACGTTFTAPNAILEWSAGESAIASHTAPAFLLTEGFHQPGLIITALTEPIAAEWELWPNPVADVLQLRTHIAIASPLQLQVYNALGQPVVQWKLEETGRQWQVSLEALAAGTYTVVVHGPSIATHTWRIAKLSGQ
jgi:hypothetical protein